MSDQTDGICWLCGKLGPLTLEHVPPKAAFNKYPLLLQEVSKQTQETGVLSWTTGQEHWSGHSRLSLCPKCNNKAGQKFAPPYIEFVKTVAERVSNITVRHELMIQKIVKPQLILRQVLMQFVTMNGPTFANANPWIKPFLQPESRSDLPPELCVYLFAINKPSVRTTGISGHLYAEQDKVFIVSEFTYWPVGTVMSYGELPYEGLAPIHQWSKIPYKANETADLTLCVNPIESSLPVDFRTKRQIEVHRTERASSAPSRSAIEEMTQEVARRSGRVDSDTILTSHPSMVELLRDR